jgi:hypothetical protein
LPVSRVVTQLAIEIEKPRLSVDFHKEFGNAGIVKKHRDF